MTSLTSVPYSYTLGIEIATRVSAFNEKGWSPASSESSGGAVAKTIPGAASAPTRGDDTSPS